MCYPETLVITHRGFVSYCRKCQCVNVCFEQLWVQRTIAEFQTLYCIVFDFLKYNEPLNSNPDLRNLEFNRFANDISWMVSINDLKDMQLLLRQAQEVIDKEVCAKKAYMPVHIKEFKEKMPELFRFGKLEN